MRQNPLMVLAPITQGQEQPLVEILDETGMEERGLESQGKYDVQLDFSGKSPSTHFARFAALEDPDAGRGRRRLLFTGDYDGPLDAYLDELEAVFNHPSGKFNKTPMDEIWGRCDLPANKSFKDFLREQTRIHNGKTLFYVGFRGETVAKIKGYKANRKRFESKPDRPTWLSFEDANKQDLWRGIPAVVGAVLLLLVTRPIALIRTIRSLFSGMPLNPGALNHSNAVIDDCQEEVPCLEDPAPPTGATLAQPNGFGRDREDAFAQNQMNIISDIQPRKLSDLKAGMTLLGSLTVGVFADGSLADISTIHFARWVRIDHDTRLLFLSNFDGSWENYIGDFTDKAYMGLDTIWRNTRAYPGSRDIRAFKQHIRCRQVQSSYFYSAYPETTVLNILSDRISGK